jgi:hypothetical protein
MFTFYFINRQVVLIFRSLSNLDTKQDIILISCKGYTRCKGYKRYKRYTTLCNTITFTTLKLTFAELETLASFWMSWLFTFNFTRITCCATCLFKFWFTRFVDFD